MENKKQQLRNLILQLPLEEKRKIQLIEFLAQCQTEAELARVAASLREYAQDLRVLADQLEKQTDAELSETETALSQLSDQINLAAN